ncbi:protein FAR1-RELATED SEQUENCE 5-like [Chenopodium quinoa]|uniref:protein FAR1-RELATED SEQUENCE 5-like n=1 Tax=Chenopodium quinoa TaxID=63459 RepID=UPI000B77DB6F|nr:protein FAR1-RELATED SEQUENCE 5-like [Chenopodium quinoa]
MAEVESDSTIESISSSNTAEKADNVIIEDNINEERDTEKRDEDAAIIDYFKYDKDENISRCFVGYTVLNYNDGFFLYKAHSRSLGFSVRKSTKRRDTNDKLYEFYFRCSKEGHTKGKMKIAGEQQSVEIPILVKTDERKRKEREVNETRTGCKAHIRFKKNTEGRFAVLTHELEHNHELVITVQRHHLRSERQIAAPMGELIESMIESGIKPMDAYNYISNEAGGEECVGHTKRDHLNYVLGVKMNMVEGGDMQNVLDTLQERADQDPSFFYRLKFGEENNFVSYFWRDSQMLEDFKAYGDVLIFDTTYRTNKYGLICAPFVGINNYWKTTMFGCAFITDEKTDTFVWLLSIFKKSMCGIEPKSIFTDQDLAMSNAIPEVYPNSRHRLCLWHLQKNFVSHFGTLKNNPEFKNMFHKCLSGCDSESEFEDVWNKMVQKHGLEKKECIHAILDRYILKRWTKLAKSMIWDENESGSG